MEFEEKLTKEHIGRKFPAGTQFDWVNAAIFLARRSVETGQEPLSNLETDNLAVKILGQISQRGVPRELLEKLEEGKPDENLLASSGNHP